MQPTARPRQSYFICTTPRTGSDMLCEVLTRTGVAGKPGEFFYPDRFPHFYEYFGVNTLETLIERVFVERTTPNGVFGAKMMTGGHLLPFIEQCRQLPAYQGRPLAGHEIMADLFPNLQYIFLTRRNKVRQAISHWKAIESDVWHRTNQDLTASEADKSQSDLLREEQSSFPAPQFYFESIDHLVQDILLREVVWQEYFDQAGVAPLTVVYEDFVRAPEDTLCLMLDYLSIPIAEDWYLDDIANVKLADATTEEWLQTYRQLKQFGWDKKIW
ncbi:MAG: hypothetical protein JXB38_01200 [Anaerolineales bacterium]|nr:hypothetical protein [Anaerolineales bacterium]